MTFGQYDYHDLVLVPLTPIHIGGGDEAVLGLEDYRLKEGFLERVDLRKFILSEPNSETLLRNLGKDLPGTISRIQEQIPDKDVTERIAVSLKVRDEIKQQYRSSGKGKTNRQGIIHAFLRSGGVPTLPGSSVKGCLRTAWLARCARENGLSDSDVGGGSSDQRHKRLMKIAFEMSIEETALDPFRDVSVNDARLPSAATRVDMVSSWKYDRNRKAYTGNTSIPLMRERMLAATDGGKPHVVPIRVGLRGRHFREQRRAIASVDVIPKRSPGSIFKLLSALEEHHAPLWQREMEKFFSGTDQRLRKVLALFDGISRGGDRPEAALVRIGWATHAEAKSVAAFREIERPQFLGKSGRFVKEGSARHVVYLSDEPCPFGWALLVMLESWQTKKDAITWLANPKQPAPPPGLGPKLKYRKGEKVRLDDGLIVILLEDVMDSQSEVQVDLEGSPEPVQTSEIEGRA